MALARPVLPVSEGEGLPRTRGEWQSAIASKYAEEAGMSLVYIMASDMAGVSYETAIVGDDLDDTELADKLLLVLGHALLAKLEPGGSATLELPFGQVAIMRNDVEHIAAPDLPVLGSDATEQH